MCISPLKNFVLPSLVIAGTVFTCLTAPLAVFGSEKLVIKLQEEPVFYGKLRDVAAPYLGFATALSLGAALGTVSFNGWRLSARKSVEIEAELLRLQEYVKEAEKQLEEMKISEAQLNISGLSYFLEDEVTGVQQVTSRLEVVQLPQEIKTLVPEPSVVPIAAISVSQSESIAEVAPNLEVSQISNEATVLEVTKTAVNQTDNYPPVQEVQTQLQQMRAQLERLEAVLQQAPNSKEKAKEKAKAKYPNLALVGS
jgi:hypothetical protein